MSQIIAFTGLAGSGKSTCAKYLLTKPNWVNLRFSEPIYKMLEVLLTKEELSNKEEVVKRFGQTPRHMLQTLGTEWGRELINSTIWIDILWANWEAYYNLWEPDNKGDFNLVIDDLRFQDEADFVLSHGGRIFEVYGQDPMMSTHISEFGVSGHSISTCIFNQGAIEDLHEQLGVILK